MNFKENNIQDNEFFKNNYVQGNEFHGQCAILRSDAVKSYTIKQKVNIALKLLTDRVEFTIHSKIIHANYHILPMSPEYSTLGGGGSANILTLLYNIIFGL